MSRPVNVHMAGVKHLMSTNLGATQLRF